MFKITLDKNGQESYREETTIIPQLGFECRADGNYYKQLGDPRCISDTIKRECVSKIAPPQLPMQHFLPLPIQPDVTYTQKTGLEKVSEYLKSESEDLSKHKLGTIDMGTKIKIVSASIPISLSSFAKHLSKHHMSVKNETYDYYGAEMTGSPFEILDGWSKYALISCNVKTKAIKVWIHDCTRAKCDIIILNALQQND